MDEIMVSILRKWHKPEITMSVDADEINLKCSLKDFLEMLRMEIGSVTWVFTNEGFKQLFNSAAEKVVETIKSESVKIAHATDPVIISERKNKDVEVVAVPGLDVDTEFLRVARSINESL